jgi:hypothetical protein
MKTTKALNIAALVIIILFTAGLSISTAELSVHDAEGTLLGLLAGNSSSNTIDVYVPSVDRTLNINISTGDLTGRDIYFESYDCSGTAYVLPEASYRVIKNGAEYFTGEKDNPAVVVTNSALRSYNSSCELLNSVRYTVPAREITLPFAMPVSLPLSFHIDKRWKE